MSTPEHLFEPATSFIDVKDFIDRHWRLFVLTGAGCSTRSGIPDHRDIEGNWKRASPMTYQVFMGSQIARQRYWPAAWSDGGTSPMFNQTMPIAPWQAWRRWAGPRSC